MKLWQSRFSKPTNQLVDELNASITFDHRLYRQDIAGSKAHATMLAEQGIISLEDTDLIIQGLDGIEADIAAGTLTFDISTEDIHMSIETELTRRIGDAGKRLHTARSRNDQVAVDFRLYVKDEATHVRDLCVNLLDALCNIAEQHTDTILPAYTHLQRAQPTTFAHHMMAYANMICRDVTRLDDAIARMDECPLGAGACTGTTYPIDRAATAKALGFARIAENSLDAVSDRDFALETMSALSILMMHLSRLSEEIIFWCSAECKFIELDDAFATGSSIMPQKKNPDIAELVRGKTGRVFGSLFTLLTVMKALPLAYNKDMQEDKEPVFDTLDTVSACLPVFTQMLATMIVLPENMLAACREGFLNATDCADYLVKKGMPFREAYSIVGKLVAQCTETGKALDELSLDDYRAHSDLFDQDIFQAIALETCVNLRKSAGGSAPEAVAAQIASIRVFIQQCKAENP